MCVCVCGVVAVLFIYFSFIFIIGRFIKDERRMPGKQIVYTLLTTIIITLKSFLFFFENIFYLVDLSRIH